MYKCNSCGYESEKWFGLCPKCNDGVGEEIATPPTATINGKPINNRQLDIKKVNKDAKPDKAAFKTQYEGFNRMISYVDGFIDSQVILLGASPGVGKSTLCISIANDRTLYISSEENYSQVNDRARRVNPGCNCDILCTTSIDDVLFAIKVVDCDLIIIDSLQGIEFGVGYQTTARYAAEITKAIKDAGKIGIIISQVARNGEISGMYSIQHVVDTVCYLERSENSANIIATCTKNRFGEIGSVEVFQHKPDGFEEVNVDHMNPKSEVGVTYTETQFGHKRMTVAVEALVAQCNGQFGIHRANGYSQNRLMQLIGILSYFGGLNFGNKDIYVAISNGLYSDDVGIELAIANSILSSLMGQAKCAVAYGEIRLNGKILNGYIDGQPISHIKELIGLYREKCRSGNDN